MGTPGAGRRNWAAASYYFLGLAIALPVVRPLHGEEAPAIMEGTRALYRGEYQQARTLAVEYLETHSEDPEARILLARGEIAQGQYESAYDELRKTLDLDPTNIDALYYLERLSTLLSQIEFRRLVETAPDSSRAHQLMAESYLEQHHEDEAEKEYEAALKASPSSVEILDLLGDLKRSRFKFDEALDYYTRASKLAPRDYTGAYGSGACYLFKQNLERAIESFRRALTIDRSSAAAHLALGDALLRAGQANDAVDELNRAVQLGPPIRQAYTLLARAHQKLGHARKAEQALRKEQELARDEIRARESIPDPNAIPSPVPQQAPPREPNTPEP